MRQRSTCDSRSAARRRLTDREPSSGPSATSRAAARATRHARAATRSSRARKRDASRARSDSAGAHCAMILRILAREPRRARAACPGAAERESASARARAASSDAGGGGRALWVLRGAGCKCGGCRRPRAGGPPHCSRRPWLAPLARRRRLAWLCSARAGEQWRRGARRLAQRPALRALRLLDDRRRFRRRRRQAPTRTRAAPSHKVERRSVHGALFDVLARSSSREKSVCAAGEVGEGANARFSALAEPEVDDAHEPDEPPARPSPSPSSSIEKSRGMSVPMPRARAAREQGRRAASSVIRTFVKNVARAACRR